ncbi:hypothetical protein ABBQ32_009695 [Trebouxia sp. C0010 RCD-2024]
MASGSRSPARSRSHSRERHRQRDHKHRHRSKSRDRSHRHSRDSRRRDHHSRDRSRRHDRSPEPRRRHRDDRWEMQSQRSTDLSGSYANTFSSGGKIHEDNGGLPTPASYQGDKDPHREGLEMAHQYGQYGSGLQEGGYTGQAGGPYPASNQHAREEAYSDQFPDQHEDQYDRGRPNRGNQHPDSQWQGFRGREPSSSVHIRGIPDEYDEADINRLFSAFPGVLHVRIVRDRGTGQSRGFGFVEFDSIESAQHIMESDLRYQFNLDGAPLRLDYSHAAQPPAAASASATSDWICPGCSAVNFSRRLECYRCCVAKPAHAATVTLQPDAPSHILKVSGLEQHISERSLHMALAQHVAVKDIRLVQDRFTGAPRGFAFVHFHSVADASRVLHALQNAVIEGQETPLRLSFARDKPTERPPPTSTIASDALQAAQAMSQYAGWEPKEFTEMQAEPPVSTWQPKEYDDSQDAAQQQQQQDAAPTAAMQWQQQQAPGHWGQGQEQQGQGQGQGQDAAQVQSWQQSHDQAQSHDWQSQQQQSQHPPHQLAGDNPQPHTQWAQDQQATVQQQSWSGQAEGWQQQQQEQQLLQAPGSENIGEDGQSLTSREQHQLPPQQLREQQGQSQSVQTDDPRQSDEGGNAQSGFVYDSASGYWHDAASGYYYDANTGMYCHPQTQQWYTQDATTGEFTPFGSEQAISGAAANALESSRHDVDLTRHNQPETPCGSQSNLGSVVQ